MGVTTLGVTLTQEEFQRRLSKCNPSIELLGEYKGMFSRIKARCKIDGYEWDPTAQTLLRNHCPRCSGKERYTLQEVRHRVSEIHPMIEVIGEYVNSTTPITCRCTVDGHVWKGRIGHLFRGVGCPKCAGKVVTDDEFRQELAKVCPDIEPLEPYHGSKVKILCRCRVCGKEWLSSPNALLKRRGCSSCNFSIGESRVAAALDSRGVRYETQKVFDGCKYKQPLRFDFYLPEYNTVVEYDGQQHFYPVKFPTMTEDDAKEHFQIVQIRDEIKNKYCAKNNIKMVRIPYTESDHIDIYIDKIIA